VCVGASIKQLLRLTNGYIPLYFSRQEVHKEDENGKPLQPEDGDEQISYIHPYTEQADQLTKHQLERRSTSNEQTPGFCNTLFLNFLHVIKHDPELADAIQGEYCRFEPYLRKAIKSFVTDLHPELPLS
jgi:hypothetical protein